MAELSIKETRQQIRDGQLGCVELAQRCIKNQLRYDRQLNAYHDCSTELFLAQARQAQSALDKGEASGLAGIPASIKSVIAVEGYACFAGSYKALPKSVIRQGSFVDGLRQMHVPVTGITHASEFAFGGLGINDHYDTPRNPWDAQNHRVPGGSSSGAAISVLQGSCLFAVGTDTGGSIRVPASAAGMVGLKTSKGLWPCDGVMPLSSMYDTLGLITRSVDDMIDVYSVLERESSVRGFSSELRWNDFSVAIADLACREGAEGSLLDVVDQAIAELMRDGMCVGADADRLFADTFTLLDEGPNTAAIECDAFIAANIPDWRTHVTKTTDLVLNSVKDVSAKEYLLRIHRLKKMTEVAALTLQSIDVVISPTLTITPPLLDEVNSIERYESLSGGMLHNTLIPSLCGLCAMTLPIGLDSQLMPVGLQLMAKSGNEIKLLQFARLVERALGDSSQRLGVAPMLL